MKLYFDTQLERDAYNAAMSIYNGRDITKTVFWYAWGDDENGFYVIED